MELLLNTFIRCTHLLLLGRWWLLARMHFQCKLIHFVYPDLIFLNSLSMYYEFYSFLRVLVPQLPNTGLKQKSSENKIDVIFIILFSHGSTKCVQQRVQTVMQYCLESSRKKFFAEKQTRRIISVSGCYISIWLSSLECEITGTLCGNRGHSSTCSTMRVISLALPLWMWILVSHLCSHLSLCLSQCLA